MLFKTKLNTITVCMPVTDDVQIRYFIDTRVQNLGKSSIYSDGTNVWFSYKSPLSVYDNAKILIEDFRKHIIKIVGNTIIVYPKKND